MSTKGKFTPQLWTLAKALLTKEEQRAVQTINDGWPASYDDLVQIDIALGGPNFSNVACENYGRYEREDEDIFRPLQYYGVYFSNLAQKENGEWFVRNIIQMTGLQLESLVKRIAETHFGPLGTLLRKPLARRRISEANWSRLVQFSKIYNASKHDINQPKDTHLFTIEDALLAYFIGRRLAASLFPLMKLHTDLAIFEKECP